MIKTVLSLISRMNGKRGGLSSNEAPERYAVFDKNDCYVGIHNSLTAAEQQWKTRTRRSGSILDINTREDLTPRPKWWDNIFRWLLGQSGFGHCSFPSPVATYDLSEVPPMSQAEIDRIKRRSRGCDRSTNPSSKSDIDDLDLLYRLVERLNQLELPVFNIAKKRREQTKKLMPVKKRRQKVRRIQVTVPETETKVFTHVRKVPSGLPENDMDMRPIRSISEIRRLARKTDLALPREVLNRKLMRHELAVTEYLSDETYEETITRSTKKTVIVDEPYIEEYVDYIEVAREPHGQLLYILRDGSGSMGGFNTHLAAAIALAVIGRNLGNSSKYLYRIFGTSPEKKYEGKTKEEKEELIRDIVADHCDCGGGTDISKALEAAAREIRTIAKSDDQPEILLITDGQDYLTAGSIYKLIGEDIILHTIVVDEDNDSLKAHSSTYTQLLEETFREEEEEEP